MGRWLPALVGWVLGCSPEALRVDVPFTDDDAAAVLVIERGGGAEVVAIDAARRAEQPLLRTVSGVSDERPLQLTAFFYREPLAALQLHEGALALSAEGRLLPDAARIEATRVTFGGAEWGRVSRAPPRVAELRIAAGSPCATLEPEAPVILPDGVRPVALLGYPERTVLATRGASSEGLDLWAVGARDLEHLARVELPIRVQVVALARTRVWIAGVSAAGALELWAGTPEAGFRLESAAISRRVGGAAAIAVAGPIEPEGTIYILHELGALSRHGAAGWEVLAEEPVEARGFGALAWVGPEELILTSPDGRALSRFAGGFLRRERTELEAVEDEAFVSVTVAPELGEMAGSATGWLLRRAADGHWAQVGSPALVNSHLQVLLPWRGGVLVGGRFGLLQQFYPSGYCVSQRAFIAGDRQTIAFIVPERDRVVVAGFGKESARGHFVGAFRIREP